jgi:UDP-glucose 4-epimerase
VLPVFGDDYPTPDGTAIRDYLHVMDLARAHVDALDYLLKKNASLTVNLGSGRGLSVLEMIRAFERTNGLSIPFRIMPRRPGDVAEVFADASLAGKLLGWRTEHSLERICEDAWRWQSMNPQGFDNSASN